jgi:hypothetical protein
MRALEQHAETDALDLADAQRVAGLEQTPRRCHGGRIVLGFEQAKRGATDGSHGRRRADVQAHQAQRFQVVLGQLQCDDRADGLDRVCCASIHAFVHLPRTGLQVGRPRGLVRQTGRLGTLLGDHRQVARGAKTSTSPWTPVSHPLHRQPRQRAWPVERKGVRGRVGAVSMRQAFQLAGHADERVVWLNARAGVRNAELGRVRHDVVDRAWAGQQRHLPSDRIDTRRLHAERGTDRADGLTGTHADMDAQAHDAQVRESTGLMRRCRRVEKPPTLDERRHGRLVQRRHLQVQVRQVVAALVAEHAPVEPVVQRAQLR